MTTPLTVDEVAALARVHPQTVRNEIRRGHLEAWKAGNALRIDPEAVERWKQRSQVSPPHSRATVTDHLKAIEGGRT